MAVLVQPRTYNRTIMQLFGPRAQAGTYGVEVELEGQGLPKDHFGDWVYHADPSLRGESAEYVFRVPLNKDKVRAALEFLRDTLKGCGSVINKDLSNCSVHVHRNVQKNSLQDVYKIASVYFILEDLLTEWCGQERVGNLFCLRATDAEYLITAMVKAIRSGQFGGLIDDQELRYAGINVTSISKFGSLEFRGLRGTKEVDVITDWVDIVDNLCEYALTFKSPAHVVQQFSAVGPQQFLMDSLKNHAGVFMVAQDVNNRMYDGARVAQDIAFAVNWEEPVAQDKLKELQANEVFVKARQGRDEPRMVGQRAGVRIEPIRWDDRDEVMPAPQVGRPALQAGWVYDRGGIVRRPGEEWRDPIDNYLMTNNGGVILFWNRQTNQWARSVYQYVPPAPQREQWILDDNEGEGNREQD